MYKFLEKKRTNGSNADMGIWTPVDGVRVQHDWPNYTISAGAYIDKIKLHMNLPLFILPTSPQLYPSILHYL